jgi:hypothetical protein
MFNSKSARSGLKWLAAVFALASLGSGALQAAAVVGQWNQNPVGTIWAASGSFSSFYSAAFVTGGHTIDPAGTTGEVTLSNLNNFTHFVLNTSTSPAAAATNFADLSTWVHGGGIAIVFLNGVNDTASNSLGNSILGALGSTISAPGGNIGSGGWSTLGSLTGSDVAVSGIQGSALSFLQPNRVSGGSLLAADGIPNPVDNVGAALRVENIGVGKVYVFGEHYENKYYINQGGNANLQLFLNLLAQGQLQNPQLPPPGGGIPSTDNPEPSTLILTGTALAAVAYWRRKR